MDDDLGGVCPCGTEDEPIEETTHHIFTECRLYEKWRSRGCNELSSDGDPKCDPLLAALGFVPENPRQPDGLMQARKALGRAAMTSAWNVWCQRNRIRKLAIAGRLGDDVEEEAE